MQVLQSLLRKKNNIRLAAGMIISVFAIVLFFLPMTVQAETTYVIKDGEETITHTTAQTDPSQVLSEAGLSLGTEDSFTALTTEEGAEIVVRRAHRITLSNRGKVSQIIGLGETVGEILSQNGIEMNENTRLSVPADMAVREGMIVSLDEVLVKTETYTVEIPFEESVTYDHGFQAGTSHVTTDGIPGELQKTVSVTYKNGREQKKDLLEEKIIREPVTQVTTKGTRKIYGEGAPVIEDGKITLPNGDVLTYTSTAQFRATAYTQNGIDVNDITATGTKVHEGVVAVDPDVIPYGTRMFIVSNDGAYIYGLSTAEDCGGAIQGNRLDLYMDTVEECFQFGIRDCTVYFLGDANWR